MLMLPLLSAISVSISQESDVVLFRCRWHTRDTDVYNNLFQSIIATNPICKRPLVSAYTIGSIPRKTITEIIQDIFTKYIAGEGITLGANINTLDFHMTCTLHKRKYVADVDELAWSLLRHMAHRTRQEILLLNQDRFFFTTAPSHLAKEIKNLYPVWIKERCRLSPVQRHVLRHRQRLTFGLQTSNR